MCRLVLMNKNGEREIEKNYGLENYLKYLEASLGGHGNGYALLRRGKIIEFNKGVQLSVKEIAKNIRRKNYDWCIFHTRLASIGEKTDKNCHPFIRNNSEVLAMNGTESQMNFLTGPLEITDTEAILDLKVTYNLELPALRYFNSVFVGFTKGTPFVVADNIYNLKLLNNPKKNAIVFASSFPDSFKKNIYKPNEKFIWNNDEINMNIFSECKNIKIYQNSFFRTNKKKFKIKDEINENDEDDFLDLMQEEYIDEFDYYSDLYDIYDEDILEYRNKEGEKNAA